MSSDDKWMRRALQLARRGQDYVHPNPLVGAVLVKNGKVIAQGFHRAYGQAHAEINALASAGERARDATLYVTLEPCAHWGKTGPCAAAVIGAGVREVIAAMLDPNPLVSGRGLAALRKAGLSVRSGLCENEARVMNRAFITWVTKKRPFVTLKAATSLDGRTATITGESQWITGPLSRKVGYRLRGEADAIAVGIETVLKDDPVLSAHGAGRNPVRIIFDSHLRTPTAAKVLRPPVPTWILVTPAAPAGRKKHFEKRNLRVVTVPAERSGRVDLPRALKILARDGITHLLVEGGMTLATSFLEARLVDEAAWFIAPLIIGSAKHLRAATELRSPRLQRLGRDWLVKGTVI